MTDLDDLDAYITHVAELQAEIDRLHKIELQFDALKEERARWRDDNEMLSEDNDRLRAALESLTKDPDATLDEPDPDWEVIVKMRAIALAALEPKP